MCIWGEGLDFRCFPFRATYIIMSNFFEGMERLVALFRVLTRLWDWARLCSQQQFWSLFGERGVQNQRFRSCLEEEGNILFTSLLPLFFNFFNCCHDLFHSRGSFSFLTFLILMLEAAMSGVFGGTRVVGFRTSHFRCIWKGERGTFHLHHHFILFFADLNDLLHSESFYSSLALGIRMFTVLLRLRPLCFTCAAVKLGWGGVGVRTSFGYRQRNYMRQFVTLWDLPLRSATLWDLPLHFNTNMMPPNQNFSCTCTPTWC